MRKKVTKFNPEKWIKQFEQIIAEHTSLPATSGRDKGHGTTDTLAAVSALASEIIKDIDKKNKGRRYDENMAAAASIGTVLVAWYCLVHRAKSYDPNRPVKLRRKAAAQLDDFRARLAALVNSDEVMGRVWSGQRWDFPFSKHAKDGKFV